MTESRRGPRSQWRKARQPSRSLAREERLAERAVRAEQLRAEDRLDGRAGDPRRRACAEQRLDALGDVADPELAVERHADAPERAERGVHGGEGDVAGASGGGGGFHQYLLRGAGP